MADVVRKLCDLCHTENDVAEIMVAPRFEKSKPWGIDLCAGCYQNRFGDLFRASHPVKRSNLKPQLRLRETVIGPENL